MAHALPDRLRGSGFGLLGVIEAVGDLISTAMVGLLWALVAHAVGFGYAAAWMAATFLAALLTAGTPAVARPAASNEAE